MSEIKDFSEALRDLGRVVWREITKTLTPALDWLTDLEARRRIR